MVKLANGEPVVKVANGDSICIVRRNRINLSTFLPTFSSFIFDNNANSCKLKLKQYW